MEAIIKRAECLMRRAESRNPFIIAREVGADVSFADLGSLKGMYSCIKRNRFILINSQLDRYTQKLVCAHELGHDQLHRQLAAKNG
jgi:Zn-dependent peptidase ImmA (M78 family)